MSLDKSLKSQGALARHRNVLSRAERVDAMKKEERWPEGRAVFGLPKVAHRKVITKKHKASKTAAEGVPAEGAPPVEGAAAAPAAAPAVGKPKGKVGS